MSTRPPVTDWATDWDHLDPHWVEDPYPIWDELRQTCPIAHTERFGGVYLPTRYKDIRDIAYDTAHFSSRKVAVRETHPPNDRGAPPITSDPPRHRLARMVLLPPFTPQAVARHEPRTRAICNELIDAFIARGHCDAAVEYAQHIPVKVIARMLGVPEADGDRFRGWINATLQEGVTDDAVLIRGLVEMTEYLRPYVLERRERPGDDLISHLVQQKYEDGRTLTDNHVLGSLRLLLVAGIDTTWSGIGSCIWHLATHAEDRRRLVREPSLMPTAIEEFLRAYAPVTMAREVIEETEVGALPVQAGTDGDAVVPGGQPRPGDVPRRRQGGHRPQAEPPRRLRARHPPLHRVEPRAHGADRGGGGAAEADTGVQPRGPGDVVGGHGARPPPPADPLRVRGVRPSGSDTKAVTPAAPCAPPARCNGRRLC